MFSARQCSRKGARRAEEEEEEERKKKKKTKMTKPDFHCFLVRHFSNVSELPCDYCEDGATPESRSKCL